MTSAFWGPDNFFKLEVFRDHLAYDDHSPHLAGVKHGEDAAKEDPANWDRLLCNDDDYIEAIFFDTELTIKGLEVVRMTRRHYEEFFDDLFDLEVKGLSDDVSYPAQTFRDILAILRTNSIPLELIDD